MIRAARSVDFYVNLHDGSWWNRLRITTLGQELHYLVFVQKVGHGETGVLTLTVYGEIKDPSHAAEEVDADRRPEREPIVMSTPTETVTWTHTDRVDSRWHEVVDVLDATLAEAMLRFTSTLD